MRTPSPLEQCLVLTGLLGTGEVRRSGGHGDVAALQLLATVDVEQLGLDAVLAVAQLVHHDLLHLRRVADDLGRDEDDVIEENPEKGVCR